MLLFGVYAGVILKETTRNTSHFTPKTLMNGFRTCWCLFLTVLVLRKPTGTEPTPHQLLYFVRRCREYVIMRNSKEALSCIERIQRSALVKEKNLTAGGTCSESREEEKLSKLDAIWDKKPSYWMKLDAIEKKNTFLRFDLRNRPDPRRLSQAFEKSSGS